MEQVLSKELTKKELQTILADYITRAVLPLSEIKQTPKVEAYIKEYQEIPPLIPTLDHSDCLKLHTKYILHLLDYIDLISLKDFENLRAILLGKFLS